MFVRPKFWSDGLETDIRPALERTDVARREVLLLPSEFVTGTAPSYRVLVDSAGIVRYVEHNTRDGGAMLRVAALLLE